MSSETQVQFQPNDIVWVKISSVFWPGEVVDRTSLQYDFTASLRKPPIALVKFFDEDKYEYPRNPLHIYHYNCPRKDEFIMKGLHGSKMYDVEIFYKDVQIAERKTGGDQNYIFSTKFREVEKYDYRLDFGLKPLKKTKQTLQRSNESQRLVQAPQPNISTSNLDNNSSSRVSGEAEERRNRDMPLGYLPVVKKQRWIPKFMLTTPIMVMEPTDYECPFCYYVTTNVNNIEPHVIEHNPRYNIRPYYADVPGNSRKRTDKSSCSRIKPFSW